MNKTLGTMIVAILAACGGGGGDPDHEITHAGCTLIPEQVVYSGSECLIGGKAEHSAGIQCRVWAYDNWSCGEAILRPDPAASVDCQERVAVTNLYLEPNAGEYLCQRVTEAVHAEPMAEDECATDSCVGCIDDCLDEQE